MSEIKKERFYKKILPFLKDRSNQIMAGTSLIGCLIAIFSYISTIRLSNENQQQYLESHRPYLTLANLESGKIDSTSTRGNVQIEFDLSIKNFGLQPAFFSVTEKNSQDIPIECFQSTNNVIMPGQTISIKCLRLIGTIRSSLDSITEPDDPCNLLKDETIQLNYGITSNSNKYKTLLGRKMLDLPKYQDPVLPTLNCAGKNKIFPWFVVNLE